MVVSPMFYCFSWEPGLWRDIEYSIIVGKEGKGLFFFDSVVSLL